MRAWRRLRDHARFFRWLPAAAWMALIFILSAQPDLPHPASGWMDLFISSAAHVFLFGVLALLLGWALAPYRRGLLLAFLLAALYAFSDEFHQAFVPGRHPDPLDLLCDFSGAALGLALWAWWRRRMSNLEADRTGG
ncbi:MAG: VanZ family protein [Anaerolineae bacterium]|jgi:VanZ family protein